MKKKSKKLNPRRIPIARKEINNSIILEEATKNDMYHAWLLVLNAMFDLEYITPEEVSIVIENVNRFMKSNSDGKDKSKDIKLSRAEQIMGIPCPYDHISPENVKSAVELATFKRKVEKVATHTALSVLCLGLESTGKYTSVQLRRIFFSVDLSLAELDHGNNTYEKLKEQLGVAGVELEREGEDIHHARILEPA